MLCGGTVGCIPLQMVESPSVRGQIIDAATGKAVPDGEAILIGAQPPSGDRASLNHETKVQRVSIDADGRFVFAETHFTWWRPLFLAADLVAQPFELRLIAPKYVPAVRHFNNVQPVDLGVISMARQSTTIK